MNSALIPSAAKTVLRPIVRSSRSLCSSVRSFEYSLTLRTLFLKASSRSDYQRWSNERNLHPSWDSRTKLMARLVPPNTRVVEFGAGRQLLRQHLDPSCTYFASDLVARTPETIVCDLNKRPLPDFCSAHYDVAVMGGVLEYVHDIPLVVSWLAKQVRTCVVSYSFHNPRESAIGEFVQKLIRRNNGWVNTYTQEGIIRVFAEVGFQCTRKEIWQRAAAVFVFEQEQNASCTAL